MEQETKEIFDEVNPYDLWKVLVKRKKLILGLFFLSVVAAAVINFIMPKIYRGEAIILVQAAANLTAKDVVDFIGIIDTEKKAKLLPTTHALIDDIRLNVLKDSKDKITVIIEVKDKNSIQPAFSEAIEYINNIDLVKLNVKEEQARLLKKSSELSSVIEASSGLLDTYKKQLIGGKLGPVGINPVDLNKKISDIKLEKLTVEQNIQRLKGGVEIASNLYIMNKPIKPRVKMNIVLAGITSIVSGVFLAFFLEYVEKIRNESSS